MGCFMRLSQCSLSCNHSLAPMMPLNLSRLEFCGGVKPPLEHLGRVLWRSNYFVRRPSPNTKKKNTTRRFYARHHEKNMTKIKSLIPALLALACSVQAQDTIHLTA